MKRLADALATTIGCVIFYHATRVLGKTILKNVDFTNKKQFGSIVSASDVQGHEGIVIDDPSISPNPFKLTGDFLVTNVTQSKFSKRAPVAESVNGKSGNEWCCFIGSFKPPHKGHFQTVLANIKDKVKGDGKFILIIGEPSKKESIRSSYINAKVAKDLFQLYCDKYGVPSNKIKIYTVGELISDPKVSAAIQSQNSNPEFKPVSAAQLASPVLALKFFINAYIESGDTVWLVRGEKDAEAAPKMFSFIEKERPDITVKISISDNVYMEDGVTPLSATALREALDSYIENGEGVDLIKASIPAKIKLTDFLGVIGQ